MWKKNKYEYKPKTLQSLLIKRLVFILVIIFILLGIYQYGRTREYLIKSKVDLLDSRFKNVNKEVILATNNDELLYENTKYILSLVSGEDICVAVINSEGEIIGKTNKYFGIKTDMNKEVKEELAVPTLKKEIYLDTIDDKVVTSSYYIVRDENQQKQIVILRDIGIYTNPVGLVQISTNIEDIESFLSEQIRVYIISAIIALLVIIFLLKLVLKHTLNPLKKLTYQLDNINENQLSTRISTKNNQIEIDILANKFNNMFNRLEKSFEREKKTNIVMKNFILDVSHELRTPLTSIQGFIEVLQLGAYKDEKNLEVALESMMTESQRLSKLVNELLLLMKLEGNISVEIRRENINDIINELKSQLLILKRDRVLKIELSEDMYCMVNKDQVKQIMYNLFQNSINHTDEVTGIIKITVSRVYKNNISWTEVSIEDNGEGIPKENINHIFDRFYRVDKHRSRKKGGYGLGLSIVKRIIDNHKGEIEVKSEKGIGSKFIFRFKEVKQ